MIISNKKNVSKKYNNPQEIFITIYNGLQQCEARIYLQSLDISTIKRIMEECFFQHPEFYYYSGYEIHIQNNCAMIIPRYIYSCSVVKKYNLQINEKVNLIVSKIGKKNIYEKILFLHDYLCKNICYEENDSDCHTIIGSIIKGKAVCDGISKAFKFFCDKLNLQCQIETGKARNNSFVKMENHSWNKLFLNGCWFNIDITFDLTSSIYGFVRHDYFLVSDIEICNTHKESKKLNLCNTSGSFYQKNNLFMDTPIKLFNFNKYQIVNENNSFEFQVPSNANINTLEKNIVKVIEDSILELKVIKKYIISLNKDRFVCVVFIYK